MPEPDAPDLGILWRGLFIAAICNLIGVVLTFYLMFVSDTFLFFGGFGLVQFAWLLPMWSYFQNNGRTEDAKGVLIAAGITVMLNAACWAALRNGGLSIG
jgi:hypothetical protein